MKKYIVLLFVFIAVSNAFSTDKKNYNTNDTFYQYLEEMDKRWQEYVATKNAEEFAISTARGTAFTWNRFESLNPYTEGYKFFIKNPIKNYTTHKNFLVRIPLNDNTEIKGIFFPVKNAKGTIIVLHGHSSNLYYAIGKTDFLIDHGYQVLVYNARYWNHFTNPWGYEAKLGRDIADIDNILSFVKKMPGVNPDKLGIYGFSFGACKSILATDSYNEIKVLIADGAWAYPLSTEAEWNAIKDDIIGIYLEKWGPEAIDLFEKQIYIEAMRRIDKPVLIIHGNNDPAVPLENPLNLYDAAQGIKEIQYMPNSAHCDAIYGEDKDYYIETVITFLDTHFQHIQ